MENFLASEEIKIVRLTAQFFEQAFAEHKNFHDEELSLIGCVAFVAMRHVQAVRDG